MGDLNNESSEEVQEVVLEDDKSTNYSVKTTESVKAKVERLAEETNLSKKDLFATMVELLEIKVSKEVFSDFTIDIEEFKTNTERLYRSFVQMIERSVSLRESENKNWLYRFEEKDEDLNKLKEELNNHKLIVAEVKELKKQLEAANNDLTIKLQDSQKSLENVQLLSDEYKNKNDFLTAQLLKFEQYEKQNIELKEQIAAVTNEANQAKTLLDNTVKDLEQKVDQLEKSIEFEKKQKALDIKEAVVNTKETLQIQIEKNNQKHQETIDGFLKKIDQLRDNNELALNKQEEAFAKERAAFEGALNKREEAFVKEREAYEAKIKALEADLAEKDNNTSEESE